MTGARSGGRSGLRRAGRVARRAGTLLVLAVFLLVAAVMAFLPSASPRRLVTGVLEAGDPSFYAVAAGTPSAAPGTLVRAEPLDSAPDGARAWRILFHSTDVHGTDLVTSGVVVAPDAPGSGTARTVVGWGHPTTGAAASCAPSNGIDPYLVIEGLPALLDDGYVVVAPDYPGLGVAGRSSYLIGSSEGNSVLDAVRAARQLPTEAGTDVLLWGHSQGGQAVLFAAQDASTYAPELRVRSVAVAAPAADLAALLKADIGDVSGITIGSYAFSAFQANYASAYPGLALTSILTDAGAAATPTMAGLCLFGSNFALHSIARPLIGNYLRADPATTQPWAGLLAANTPGGKPIPAPLFVAQGTADQLVVPSATTGFVTTICASKARVTYREYPGATHGSIADDALPEVLSFFESSLAGTPPASTCTS